jgi:hypothetical protein
MHRDIIDRLLNGRDASGIFVRNVGAELIFEFHHEFDRPQRVCPKSSSINALLVIFSGSTPNCSATIL